MPRRHENLLEDIDEAIQRINTYIDDMDKEDFLSDQKTVDAVIKNLENIGEAVKNLPDNLKEDDIEWEDIAGFRDILVHQYFRADEELVWDIVQTNLPELKKKMNNLKE